MFPSSNAAKHLPVFECPKPYECRWEENNQKGGENMSYSKLRGKIREVFGTQEAFAEKMGIDTSTLSFKLNNKSDFTVGEVVKACQLLGVEAEEAYLYFFTV